MKDWLDKIISERDLANGDAAHIREVLDGQPDAKSIGWTALALQAKTARIIAARKRCGRDPHRTESKKPEPMSEETRAYLQEKDREARREKRRKAEQRLAEQEQADRERGNWRRATLERYVAQVLDRAGAERQRFMERNPIRRIFG